MNTLPTISKLALSKEYPGCVLMLVNGYEGIYVYDIQNMSVFNENTPQFDFASRVRQYGQEYLERCIVVPRNDHSTELIFIEFTEPQHDMIRGGIHIDFPHDVFENSQKILAPEIEDIMESSEYRLLFL